jgi:hypothetical protein
MVFSTTATSAVLLILAIIVIALWSRMIEMKLLLIGIFMAITASVQSNVAAVSVNAAQVAVSAGLGSGALMRIAVILTLSGIGMMLLARVTPPATTGIGGERSHVA